VFLVTFLWRSGGCELGTGFFIVFAIEVEVVLSHHELVLVHKTIKVWSTKRPPLELRHYYNHVTQKDLVSQHLAQQTLE